MNSLFIQYLNNQTRLFKTVNMNRLFSIRYFNNQPKTFQTSNLELYVKYLNNQPVSIDTSYGKGPDRNRPLTDVSDLITFVFQEPTRALIGIPKDTGPLTLHLPLSIEKDTLPEDYYSSGDILRPGLLLSHLKNISDDRNPLIIKTIQPTTQGIIILVHTSDQETLDF
jgi:hypothetical protein